MARMWSESMYIKKKKSNKLENYVSGTKLIPSFDPVQKAKQNLEEFEFFLQKKKRHDKQAKKAGEPYKVTIKQRAKGLYFLC